MAKKKTTQIDNLEFERTERIKRLVVIAMFSDDKLLHRFVLKGGNALDLVHKIGTRASIDIDLSMENDFKPEELAGIRQKLEDNLQATFVPEGYRAFDVTIAEKPEVISPEIAGFWGGYDVAFKLIGSKEYEKCADNIDAMRRNALKIGGKGKFEIDISKFEFCKPKKADSMDGYRIFVYTPEMLVLEKLRAICQQMPEYGAVVKRNRPGAARARDFVDIHRTIECCKLAIETPENLQLLRHIFEAKKVPLSFLGRVGEYRDFHCADFQAVKDTIKPGVAVNEFDFYFDFVAGLCQRLLKALGDV
jgi:hypothetical protein